MEKHVFICMLEALSCDIRAKGLNIRGCSPEQLYQLEKKYGHLPNYYKTYLTYFGLEAGDFKQGTSVLFDELDDINECAQELMLENQIAPPLSMFAFLLHQGYSTLFFTDVQNDDPPVYCYTEGDCIKDLGYSFSACIAAEIEEYRRYN
ncbi:SMI1/KNR4 family protein [Leminorella grimontii]|uniref:SMI1/KNR4 family protein n=1 Tax=Leminorella grimontii TaxID=82981 RepID=UPI002088BAA6|nr:SMI1/KNR4 family protein [Leminorella grimontii]GKX58950.1 hypothetical protein SOASR031_12650 [Leminorella grimontii]